MRDLDLEDRVEFIRQVANSGIAGHYRQADIYAMATHYEGLCIPVLEAMAAGLPIVASTTGPIPEVLGGTGLLVDNKPVAFTRALQILQNDAQWREDMGAAARQRAEVVNGVQMEEREKHLYRVMMDRRQGELDFLLSDAGRFIN